jgi:glyoxylase-like metal-dependent hydrolase (beta-lactamase superfamily II)
VGAGTEARQAEQLYDSLFGKLLTLPDHIEVFPAHFSGAACGKGLSGKPGSTIGFERRFNPALQQRSKEDFVRFVMAELPPEPAGFAQNRRRNLGAE